MDRAPSLGRIKDVIRNKGYGDLFAVNISEKVNNQSGEIPLDFLHFILHTPGAIEVVKDTLAKNGYVPSPVVDTARNTEIISDIQNALIREGIDKGEQSLPEDLMVLNPASLSRLLFVGVRSRNFGGWFDDWLVITNRDGSLFKAFPAHTDLDYSKVHSSPAFAEGSAPFVIKPGFYPNLFRATLQPDNEGILNWEIVQEDPIDLYALTSNPQGDLLYQQIMRGNFQLSIGCEEESSNDLVTKRMFAVELKNHPDCNEIDELLDKYRDNFSHSENFMFRYGNKLYQLESNMFLFPYLLLEEQDFYQV